MPIGRPRRLPLHFGVEVPDKDRILRSPRHTCAGVRISFLSIAFAFKMQAPHRSEPSQVARPLAEPSRFQWHHACDQHGQSSD